MPTYVKSYSRKSRRNNKKFFARFRYNWAIGNIFCFRDWDGIAYAILYIFLPICVTVFSLLELSNDMISAANCYFTIIVSSANCFYDAVNRRDFGQYTSKNAKLGFIIFACAITFLYGAVEMIAIFYSQSLKYRCDYILLSFLPVVVIAFIDVIAIYGKKQALKDAIND